MTELRLSEQEFQLLRRIVYTQTGIVLGSTKRAMVEARLRSRLRELGLPSFLSYYRMLRQSDFAEGEAQHLINRITTNTTAFFRELPHFSFLAEQFLPAWLRRAPASASRLRIWSAGCSTGQEPYSLAAVVHSATQHRDIDAKILATDVSSQALGRAQAACYPIQADSLLPMAWRGGFVRQRQGDKYVLAVTQELRRLVVFRLLNLLTPQLPFHGKFDAIFCRNVLIYFDSATRHELIRRFMALLAPEGCLFLGLSEGLVQPPPGLVSLGQSIYRLGPGAAAEHAP